MDVPDGWAVLDGAQTAGGGLRKAQGKLRCIEGDRKPALSGSAQATVNLFIDISGYMNRERCYIGYTRFGLSGGHIGKLLYNVTHIYVENGKAVMRITFGDYVEIVPAEFTTDIIIFDKLGAIDAFSLHAHGDFEYVQFAKPA